MLKKIKYLNLFVAILFILGTPVLFIGILKFYYLILPGKEIGKIGDWISFSGGYVGAILALGGIWWQINNSKIEKESEAKDEYKNIIKYIYHISTYNLTELNKSKENLKCAWTFQKIFIDENSLLKYQNFNSYIIDKYSPFFLKNGHSCILDLYLLITELKDIIKITVENSNVKNEKIKNITLEHKKLKERIKFEIKNENKSSVYLTHLKEQQMILHNFLNCSKRVNNPHMTFTFICEINKTFTTTLLNSSNLKNVIFKNYTSHNILPERKLSQESFFDLYKEYYKELQLVFSDDIFLITEDEKKFYANNINLSKDISHMYIVDKKREELIEDYEKTLISVIEILQKHLH